MQEKIIVVEVVVIVLFEWIYYVEDKMLDYFLNVQGVMQNFYQIKCVGELVVKEILQNCSLFFKLVGGNLKGIVIVVMVLDELMDVVIQMMVFFFFMKQLVILGKYDVMGDDGKNEKYKVNLLNVLECYYIVNEVVSWLEVININLFILVW